MNPFNIVNCKVVFAKLLDLPPGCNTVIGLGKGYKIKLIIFAEFPAKGVPPTPPSRKIINFCPKKFYWLKMMYML